MDLLQLFSPTSLTGAIIFATGVLWTIFLNIKVYQTTK